MRILASADPYMAIRTITHSKPIAVFWVGTDCRIYDAKNAHHGNPPNGDRSVLADPCNKGFLRGRAALIGTVPYIVIYGDSKEHNLSRKQLALLKKSCDQLLAFIEQKSRYSMATAKFITETGETIEV